MSTPTIEKETTTPRGTLTVTWRYKPQGRDEDLFMAELRQDSRGYWDLVGAVRYRKAASEDAAFTANRGTRNYGAVVCEAVATKIDELEGNE